MVKANLVRRNLNLRTRGGKESRLVLLKSGTRICGLLPGEWSFPGLSQDVVGKLLTSPCKL